MSTSPTTTQKTSAPKKNLPVSVITRKIESPSAAEMTQLVLPQHANILGNVFGGTLVSWVDLIAAVSASRHCGGICVTASIDTLSFLHPVKIGEVVNLYAHVNYAGNTSMEVGIRVESENLLTRERYHTASAFLTFVHIGKEGQPLPVPPVVPNTPQTKGWYEAALMRRQSRLQLRQQIAQM